MSHVKHMGWELELVAVRIVKVLALATDTQRAAVIEHLKPRRLQLAVRDMLEQK